MKTSGAIVKQQESQKTFWWRQKDEPACIAQAPKPGDMCPACGSGVLAYDGLFMLTCPRCGKTAESGAFT